MKPSARRRLFTALTCLLAATPGRAADLPTAAWKADLEFLARELPKRHKNLFFRLPRTEFDAEVHRISESLPVMDDAQVRVALVSLVASARNGHTWLNALIGSADYPLRFREFPDGLYVVAARVDYTRAIGARLTAIGGVDVEEVKRRLLPLVLRENDLMAVVQLPGFLSNAQALRGTRILPETDEATFHFEKDSSPIALTVRALPIDKEGQLVTSADALHYQSPLYLTNRQTLYWFRYLSGARTLYVQYNECREMKDLPFKQFMARVMEAAEHNPVDKILLDLRHNGGGDSQVLVPLMSALKHSSALRHTGGLFVATSPFTFSSGLLNALQLKKQLHAIIVGEPPSQRPNTYGDVRTFQLPNSGATVGYPTKFFRLMPGDPEYLEPDVSLKLTAHDYFSGRDPVLEYVAP